MHPNGLFPKTPILFIIIINHRIVVHDSLELKLYEDEAKN